MEEKLTLVDGITQLINGSDFLSRISSFIDSNCSMFDEDVEYTPGQFALWKEFTNEVNMLLEKTLVSLGCRDLKDFVVALEDPDIDTSPRTVAVIDSLRSMDDFVQFHDNMVSRNGELERQETTVAEERTVEHQAAVEEAKIDRVQFTSINFRTSPPKSATTRQKRKFPSSSQSLRSQSYEIQLAIAMNLVQCQKKDQLNEMQLLQLPWAEAIIATKTEFQSIDKKKKAKLQDNLNKHKLKVDFIIVRQEINDRRER